MKTKSVFCLLSLGFLVININAYERAPIAISPSSDEGVAVVAQICPTFSWSAVDWAEAYKLAVFKAVGNEVLTIAETEAVSSPVLNKVIRGRALSWTPSSDEHFLIGIEYIWYVQAIDAYGQGIWSEGSMFRVDVTFSFDGMEEMVRMRLLEQGMSEEVIDGVLVDMKSGVENVIAYGIDTQNSNDSTPNRMSIQDIEGEGATYTLFGIGAGFSLTSGYDNTFIGHSAGYHTLDGYYNTFIGVKAGYSNSDGYNNTFVGTSAGNKNSGGDENTFIGRSAGYNNISGGSNSFVGVDAGSSNNTGSYNTFMGYEAGLKNFSGGYNCFLGSASGSDNIDGQFNTFLGNQAGYKSTTGDHNTHVGCFAGYNNITGERNVFLGYQAGSTETGSNKLYIDSSDTSSPLIWGDFSSDIVAINGQLGVGTHSPGYPMELERTGTNASIIVDRTDGAMNYINATAGYANFGSVRSHPLRLVVNSLWRFRLDSDNSLTMRNGATCTAGGEWQNASSRELKENIRDLTAEEAEEALEGLAPVRFNYKADRDDESLGFIAEDVPDLVATKDRKGMSTMDVVAVLTKVVQEQQVEVQRQQVLVEKQQEMSLKQQEIISELQRRIDELEKN